MAESWKRAGEPGAQALPPWLVVGDGPDGPVSVVAIYLARTRQSLRGTGLDSFVAVDEVEFLDDPGAIRRSLACLLAAGVAHRRDGPDGEEWSVTDELVRQIDEAYADRPAMPVVDVTD